MTEAMIEAPISNRAFRTLAAIVVLGDYETRVCTENNEAIAAKCRITTSAVQQDLRALERAGLLSRSISGPKRTLKVLDPSPARVDKTSTLNPARVDETRVDKTSTLDETSTLSMDETSTLTVDETSTLHYYRDNQSIQSCVADVRAHVRPDPNEVDRVAVWAGNYATVFDAWVRAQSSLYPIAWIEAAVDKAMGAGAKRPNYAKTILESWQRDGGPPAPAPAAVAPVADAPAPPPRRFETYKQRAKREQRERFLARHAEINRRLDEEEAANAAM
jgi:hypothetical protein